MYIFNSCTSSKFSKNLSRNIRTSLKMSDQDQLISNNRAVGSDQPPAIIDTRTTQQQDFDQNSSQAVSSSDTPDEKTTSQWSALFLAINVTIGAGLLAMPNSFQTAGLITSLIAQFLILIFVIGTCIITTQLVAITGAKSYHQLVEIYCNRAMYRICNTSILLVSFGASIAFIVIVGDQFDRVFATINGPYFCHEWYMNRKFTMVITTVVAIGPMCYSRTVDFLKYASSIGVLSLLFITYLVLSSLPKDKAVGMNLYPTRWTDFFLVFPVLCFAYQCHLSWVPVAAALPRSDRVRSCITISAAMIISAILYTIISTTVLFSFGATIEPDFMENYKGRRAIIIAALLILALKCVLTYPLIMFPARIALNDILCDYSQKISSFAEPMRRSAIATFWILSSLLLALFMPNILIAVDILGCLSSAFVFIFPGACLLQAVYRDFQNRDQQCLSASDKLKIIMSCFFILFGTFLAGLILATSMEKIMYPQANGSAEPLCKKS